MNTTCKSAVTAVTIIMLALEVYGDFPLCDHGFFLNILTKLTQGHTEWWIAAPGLPGLIFSQCDPSGWLPRYNVRSLTTWYCFLHERLEPGKYKQMVQTFMTFCSEWTERGTLIGTCTCMLNVWMELLFLARFICHQLCGLVYT